QVGDLERFGSGPISSEMGAELLEDSFAILLGLHVDEVADDDSADVPEAELPGDLPSRIQVGLEDRLFGILLPGVAAGVHIDRDERLRRLDDDVPTGGEGDLPLEGFVDLSFDLVAVEERQWIVEELDPFDQRRVDLVEVMADLLVDFRAVDDERIDLAREQ